MFRLNKFSYFHHFNSDAICLNLINKKSIIIENQKYELIMSNSSNLDKLFALNKNLWSVLYKIGIIVDDKYDEYSEINLNYNLDTFKDTKFRLTLIPTMNCNFKCWYCYENHKKGKMLKNVQQSVIKLVKNKIRAKNINQIDLDWFGGEPLLCFNDILYPLSMNIKNIANENNLTFTNQITTNGFLLNNKKIELLDNISLNSFQITLDGNEFNHNKIKINKNNNSYKQTIANINLLCNKIKDINLVLRINWTDENIENCTDIIKDIHQNNRNKIKISFQRVWQLKNLNNTYSQILDKKKKEFKDNGFKIDELAIHFVQSCYADRYEQAVINYDGLVFKCTARDYTDENSDGVLNEDGNIVWNEHKFNKRMGNKRYNNNKCMKCDLLPACYGPCSQKVLETPGEHFDRICNYDGIKMTINDILERKYHEVID